MSKNISKLNQEITKSILRAGAVLNLKKQIEELEEEVEYWRSRAIKAEVKLNFKRGFYED